MRESAFTHHVSPNHVGTNLMTPHVRKQISIESDQAATLKRIADETGLLEAEIIRRAIDQYAQSLDATRYDLRVWTSEREFIMQLIEHGKIPGERSWRREDLYER
jgi:hypothetical protein